MKVKIAITIIIVFSSLTVLTFISILIIKAVKMYKRLRDTRYLNQLENYLNEVIAEFEESTDEQKLEVNKKLKKKSKKLWQKQILIDVLIHYHQNLIGQIQDYIKELFFNLKLHDIATNDLKHGNTKMMVRAMRNLSEMRCTRSWIEIIKYINHKRKLIRVEATIALIYITKNPLFFLNDLKYSLTRWQMINMYKKLKELPDEKLPQFEKWINSPNESVQEFVIDMIARFNQSESIEKLAAILPNASEKVQIVTIDTLIQLSAFEQVDIIKNILVKTDNPALQKIAIKAIGDLAMDDTYNQIVSSFLNSPELKVRFAAVEALQKLDNGEEIILAANVEHPEFITPILDHLKDPLLH
jgi:hypothetical protein